MYLELSPSSWVNKLRITSSRMFLRTMALLCFPSVPLNLPNFFCAPSRRMASRLSCSEEGMELSSSYRFMVFSFTAVLLGKVVASSCPILKQNDTSWKLKKGDHTVTRRGWWRGTCIQTQKEKGKRMCASMSDVWVEDYRDEERERERERESLRERG